VPPGQIIRKARNAASHPTSHKQHRDTRLATAPDRPTRRVSQSPEPRRDVPCESARDGSTLRDPAAETGSGELQLRKRQDRRRAHSHRREARCRTTPSGGSRATINADGSVYAKYGWWRAGSAKPVITGMLMTDPRCASPGKRARGLRDWIPGDRADLPQHGLLARDRQVRNRKTRLHSPRDEESARPVGEQLSAAPALLECHASDRSFT
jgi:hypothetical protein